MTVQQPDIDGIPRAARALWRELLEQEPVDADALRSEVLEYARVIRETSSKREFCDVATADKLVEVSLALLKTVDDDTSEGERRLVQAAVRYFVLQDDGEQDFASVTGFDDDAAVVNAVLRHLGHDDWLISLD